MPSMVVIFLPWASLTLTWQDFWALPSICTVHEPHWATPQPYFVPVSPSCSLITQRRGTSGFTSTSYFFPLTSSVIIERLRFRKLMEKTRLYRLSCFLVTPSLYLMV